MDDSQLVGVRDGARELRAEAGGTVHRERAARHQRLQGLAGDVLHDDAGARSVDHDVVDRGYVRVLEVGGRLRLLERAHRFFLGVGLGGGEGLERDPAVQAAVMRQVHLAHPALAEFFDDFVRTDPRAEHRRERRSVARGCGAKAPDAQPIESPA